MSKSDLDSYVVKRSERPLLEEVAGPRLPFPIKSAKFSKSESLPYEAFEAEAAASHV